MLSKETIKCKQKQILTNALFTHIQEAKSIQYTQFQTFKTNIKSEKNKKKQKKKIQKNQNIIIVRIVYASCFGIKF